jgi:hypothetical protein
MSIAHKGALVGAKVIAASVLGFAYDAGFIDGGEKAVRAGNERQQVFFAAAARCQAAGRFEQRDDGKVPPGDAKVLPEQKSAV